MEGGIIDITSYLSEFGVLHIASNDKGIFSLKFYGARASFIKGLVERFEISKDSIREDSSKFHALFVRLESYFASGEDLTGIDLDLKGTDFQLAVWRVMLEIPFGSVLSYKEVARRAGSPRAAQAVGGACRANPVPLIVPCHRVISSTGASGGYSAGLNDMGKERKGKPGGVRLKRKLLKIEGVKIKEG
jgi:O-6-methylguanine DNA methyltransferase